MIYVEEGVSFVMADIPGIIEGAAEGAGLGHDFLRHIDRCRLLVHIVDVSGSEGRDPIEDFEKINAELAEYSAELASRPMIVAANKCDLIPQGSDNLERLRAYVEARGYPFYEISAATTQGTRQLVRAIAGKLSTLPPVTIYEPEYVKPLAEAATPRNSRSSRWTTCGSCPANGSSSSLRTSISPITSRECTSTASCARAVCSSGWRKWGSRTAIRSAFTTLNSITSDKKWNSRLVEGVDQTGIHYRNERGENKKRDK